MKTRTIFKAANKLVWETIWFGFWTLLIVVLVARPPLFYESYKYTPTTYFDDAITLYSEQLEGVVEVSPDDHRAVFIKTISQRVDIIRYLMIIYFLILILLHYKKQIYNELPPDLQRKYDNYEVKYNKFLKTIRW